MHLHDEPKQTDYVSAFILCAWYDRLNQEALE